MSANLTQMISLNLPANMWECPMCKWIMTAFAGESPDEIEAKLYNHFSIHSPVDWLAYVEKVRSDALKEANAMVTAMKEKLKFIGFLATLPDAHYVAVSQEEILPTRTIKPSSFTCDYGFPNCTHPVEAPDVCPNYEAMTSELVPPPDEGRM